MTLSPSPDLLILHTDQWRWDALGCLGSPVRTPAVDRLVADGVHFDHAVVQSPVSMPSRVSMLTGRYPSSLGITSMGVPVPIDVQTLATVLRRRGWRTANHGKLHFQPHANRDHTGPHPSYGFDVLKLCDEPGVYEDDYRAWVRSVDPAAVGSISIGLPPAAAQWQSMMGLDPRVMHPDDGPREDFDGPHPFGADESLAHTAWVASSVLQHLAALPLDQPSMCIANFFAPHPPFYVPQRFLNLYERSALPRLRWTIKSGLNSPAPSSPTPACVRSSTGTSQPSASWTITSGGSWRVWRHWDGPTGPWWSCCPTTESGSGTTCVWPRATRPTTRWPGSPS